MRRTTAERPPARRALASRTIGTLALEPNRLGEDLRTLASLELRTCTGYAVGPWAKCILLERDRSGAPLARTEHGTALPYVAELVERAFSTEHLCFAQLFVARNGGYVRPHRDWNADAPMFVRVHVPLQTDELSLHAEDELAYHMRPGEIWFVDASRIHSAGCFSRSTPRVHLVLDFASHAALDAIVRIPAGAPRTADPCIVRKPFTGTELRAVHGLAHIATERNFSRIADLVGTIHFERDVHCAAVYDWLAEIARRSGDAALVERARQMRRTYLDPFGAELGS